jgi:iron complex outermembrane receptor protein
VPLHSAAVWADYNLTAAGVPGLTLGAGVRYASSTNLPGYPAEVPGQFLVDAMAAYDFGAVSPQFSGLSLTVNARNLFNRGYLSCAGATGCRYGDPRTLYATLSYRW